MDVSCILFVSMLLRTSRTTLQQRDNLIVESRISTNAKYRVPTLGHYLDDLCYHELNALLNLQTAIVAYLLYLSRLQGKYLDYAEASLNSLFSGSCRKVFNSIVIQYVYSNIYFGGVATQRKHSRLKTMCGSNLLEEAHSRNIKRLVSWSIKREAACTEPFIKFGEGVVNPVQ